ncbi:hypothetical protein ZOSMA_85G00200 [Zostera marina]|uniref:Uncharacterized protein n=1 Tax=Zostera marina TaxID=29655 RepID=A0A0K9NLG4_ZOSMR|nr:hypothetical protein ZOSMA_85G00200 [Zostera marina]
MGKGCIDDRRHRWKSTSLIWILTTFLIYLVLRVLLSSSKSLIDSLSTSISDRRTALYDMLSSDLVKNGPVFLRGKTSQYIFDVRDGVVTPLLKGSYPPVRANILYISSKYSIPISHVIKDIFLPDFDQVIWFQNTTLYHFSMFHASHNVTSVFATDIEIEAEVNTVKSVADGLCPLKAVLDRVVLTSSGVLLGCWQVSSGSDPLLIRTKLKEALPRAPDKQVYDPVILHSTFARIFGHPNIQLKEQDEVNYLQDLVSHVNNKLRGFQATINELWYVEEFDVLALALDGKMKIRKCHLGCSSKLLNVTL